MNQIKQQTNIKFQQKIEIKYIVVVVVNLGQKYTKLVFLLK